MISCDKFAQAYPQYYCNQTGHFSVGKKLKFVKQDNTFHLNTNKAQRPTFPLPKPVGFF